MVAMKLDLKKIVIFLFILAIVIKLVGLNSAIYDDEANYAFSITNADDLGFNPHYYSPILMQWIGVLTTSIFGISTVVFRAIPFITSFFTLGLTYVFAKEVYNKKAAFTAVVLMLTSFYFTLASLQLDVEGSLVTLFVLATIYSFWKYEKTHEFPWGVASGIAGGLALMSKNTSIVIAPILAIYVLIKYRLNVFKAIKSMVIPGIVTFFIGLGYLILSYIDNPNNVQFLLGHGAPRVGVQLTLLSPAMFLFWATPLLIGLALLALFKFEKQDTLFLVWLSVAILFNTFVINTGDFSRYYMHTIPAMAILGGVVISKFRFNRKQVLAGVVVGAVYYVIIVLLNARLLKLVPRIMSYYMSQIKLLDFNFLFSYTSSSGPTFGVSFLIILLTFSLSAILLFLIVVGRKTTKFATLCLVLFLAINIAFNAVLIQEYVFHVQGPDPSQATYDLVEYFYQNNLSYPVYSNDEGILFYLDYSYWASNRLVGSSIVSLPDNEFDVDISAKLARVQKDGGTVLLLNWPQIPDESQLWEVTSKCTLISSFYSNDYLIGSVYTC